MTNAAAGLRAATFEFRNVVKTAQDELEPKTVGAVVVSGMLAEQLARELGAGAAAGAVTVGDGSRFTGAEVLCHVIAGDPSNDDEELVAKADRAGVPIVLVQLWPQAGWGAPFVLSPFVVECRPGEGFPVREIADRIVEAVEHAPALAARIPVLEEAAAAAIVRATTIRSALLAVSGGGQEGVRALIALEQVRMLSRLSALTSRPVEGTRAKAVLAGEAGAIVAAGYALRTVARVAGRVLPRPLVDLTVAAVGTRAIGEAIRRVSVRSGS